MNGQTNYEKDRYLSSRRFFKNALIKARHPGAGSRRGVNGLSLRKVARKAGVSHNAPYAIFEDKQALIASIAVEWTCQDQRAH